MIISRGRNYIFVHIPKTGGTAMALALEDRAKADDILIGDTPKAVKRRKRLKPLSPRGRLWKHSKLADIDGVVSEADLTEMFVFTLVRNPWDRLVSYYCWLQAQSFKHPAVILAKSLDFDAFLRHPHTVASLQMDRYAAYVTSAAGVEHCAAFIRLEHLADDLAKLEAHLGFSLEMGRANASDRRADYRSYYSEDLAAHVGEMCGPDIARFGYAFDG